MKKSILIVALVLASSGPSFAQESTDQQPSSSNANTVVRTPQSSSGASTGMSGNVGSPTPMYPSRLRDYNDPAASYGRFSPYTGVRPNRR